MTLIICEECGKKYSSNAKACPECANPTPKVIEEVKVEEPKVEVKPVNKEKKPIDGVKLTRIIIGIGALLFLLLHVAYFIFTYGHTAIAYMEWKGMATQILSGGVSIVVFHIILLPAVILTFISAFKKNNILNIIAAVLFFLAGGVYFISEAYYMSTYISYISFIYMLRKIISYLLIVITPCVFGAANIFTIFDYNKNKDKAKINIVSIFVLLYTLVMALFQTISLVMYIISLIIDFIE